MLAPRAALVGGQRPDRRQRRPAAGPAGDSPGIPNIFAPIKLGAILSTCRGKAGSARLQVCCDHSFGLLRSVNNGYLDVVLTMGDKEEMKNALTSWPEEVVWARAPDFVLAPDAVVPLVSSPNLLFPDRMAREALERANRPYEVAFTAFDTLARRAAAAAGIGYLSIPRLILPPPLVIEAPRRSAGAAPASPWASWPVTTSIRLSSNRCWPASRKSCARRPEADVLLCLGRRAGCEAAKFALDCGLPSNTAASVAALLIRARRELRPRPCAVFSQPYGS